MVSLCRDSTYTEFFWFPNRGTDEGYWENCWIDDGKEEDAVDINESVADEYQVTKNISSSGCQSMAEGSFIRLPRPISLRSS